MTIDETPIPGVLVLTPRRFGDARGWFSEVYSRAGLARARIQTEFVQDNHSYSAATGTLRGLHFQRPPHAQAKLVRCGRGTILDVAVDVRAGSPTYGHWFGTELSAENGRQLLVPVGCLHGFVTRTPDCEVLYKCSDVYAPDCDGGIRWNDPDIDIDWGLTGEPVLSDKDRAAPFLRDWTTPFAWEARP
jgi:dTDP-4-dehydrorhamnose 3,5-epimerase